MKKVISEGVYKDSETGHFLERPVINGRRTWRVLKVANLKAAKELHAAHVTDQTRAAAGLCRDPYGPAPATFDELIEAYKGLGCPRQSGQARTGKQLTDAEHAFDRMTPFWRDKSPEDTTPEVLNRYAEWRKGRMKYRATRDGGNAIVDHELGLLSSLVEWARRTARFTGNNPFEGRIAFSAGAVRKCRDAAPHNAEELHALARYFFEAGPRSEVVGWQLLLEAMTGCRTNEVLAMRWNAAPRTPGFIETGANGERHLYVQRSKGGVNPFVVVHPALATCLERLKAWRDWRHPTSPFFLPSPAKPGHHLNDHTLTQGLRACAPLVVGEGRQLTSHGLRSYYVTVRRDMGIPDAQIAIEIGDSSGAAIIVQTYGAIPAGWQGSANPMGWLPKGAPAWDALAIPANVLPMMATG